MVIELLEVEIRRIKAIAKGFRIRAEYREEEARRFQVIVDILEREKVSAKEVRRIRVLTEVAEKIEAET